MRRRAVYPPLPPAPLPPARTVLIDGRGEFFVRDSHPQADDRPAVLLLHGWVVTADLNWCGAYEALIGAGYRVVALDHRGHGRGLRPMTAFRLRDCADDAAAVVQALGVAPVVAVGYSMGGTIAQLLARDHRALLTGVVLSATSQHFQDDQTRRLWRLMGAAGLALSLAPRTFYRAGFRRNGIPLDATTAWWLSELERGSARDVAEAGRELGRFDSRPWLGDLEVPWAMVLTTRDTAVSPANQRELAQATRATVFEAAIDHLDLVTHRDRYNPALLAAVAAVRRTGSG